MEHLLVYDRKKKERESIILQIRDHTALFSDERLDVRACGDESIVWDYLDQNGLLNLAVMEISRNSDIELTREMRRIKSQIEMMLVADSSVSPMEYMTPDIRACSLLLRPCTEEQIRQVVRSFTGAYFRSRENAMDQPAMLIESRQGMVSVPYASIYYIEVQGKKLFIRLQDKEYTKYDSLENTLKALPDYYIQCHRSFVFNTRFMEKVRLSDNTIFLEHGITVPLSRSYKPRLKEYMDGRQ